MEKKKLINTIFYFLVVIFVVLMGGIFFLNEFELKRTVFPLIAVLAIIYFLLGIVLVVLVKKRGIKGWRGKYLYLTGICASGIFLGSVLHNVFYALGIISADIKALSFLMEILHVVFFLVGVIVCPLGFLVGVIGTMVLSEKNKRQK